MEMRTLVFFLLEPLQLVKGDSFAFIARDVERKETALRYVPTFRAVFYKVTIYTTVRLFCQWRQLA